MKYCTFLWTFLDDDGINIPSYWLLYISRLEMVHYELSK